MSLSGTGKLSAPTTSVSGENDSRRHPWHPPEIDTSSPLAQGQLLMNNTLTGTKHPFCPRDQRHVKWYACGPTVYDTSHVGHARTYLSLDIMRRIMTDYFHYNVLYHVNMTDIDDKIILRARQNLLVKQLQEKVKSGKKTLADIITLVLVADEEAQAKAQSKQTAIEAALKEATANNDTRAKVEQLGLLEQHKVKRGNLENFLVKQLQDEVKSGKKDPAITLVKIAIEEATAKAKSKQAEMEAALEATAKNSAAREEQEGLLKQHEKKRGDLDKTSAKIKQVIKEKGDEKSQTDVALEMIAAAKSVVADKLDAEKGHEVTDHAVFDQHARYYEREFMEDMQALGIREPDVLTRVTEYIPQIIAFIDKIVKRDMAYESNGSVYLSLDKFQQAGHNYRKLSPSSEQTSAAEMAEGEGALGGAGGEKRNPNDFALWKLSKPGEPAWDSPWGKGRPGWHIECSVVASDILGENLDIHSGGEDLKFPHHDNELAQSEACLGSCIGGGGGEECHQWVNYFTHTGHLHIAGLKMSKSLKNFITIREALEQASARLLRILFLMQAWDQSMQFSKQTLEDARSKETTFKSFFREVEALSRQDYLADEVGWRMAEKDRALCDALLKAQQTVHNCLLDNFNTQGAMNALLTVITEANVYLRTPDVKPAVLSLKAIAVYVTQILKVFGVVTGNDNFGFEAGGAGDESSSGANAVEPMIDTMVTFREKVRNEALAAAKASKDDPAAAGKALQAILQTCDALRDEVLPTVGVRLEDRTGGTRWNREDPAAMMKELQEKKAREAEQKIAKLEKQLVAKNKELAKLKDSLVAPDQMFRTDEFKEWDETGVPTVNADGTPVSGGQMKKKKKAIEKQAKMYQDLMTKSDNNPQAMVDAAQGEVTKIEEQLAALSL